MLRGRTAHRKSAPVRDDAGSNQVCDISKHRKATLLIDVRARPS
jgi:hypothetical protein